MSNYHKMDQEIKKINTMAELQEEKARLRREIEISKTELMRSLGTTRSHAGSLLLKGVAIPAGVAGLTVAGVKAVQAIRKGPEDHEPEEYLHYNAQPPGIFETIQANLAASSKWYLRLLPSIFQMVKSYLTSRQTYQQADVEDAQTYPREAALPATSR